MENEMILKLLNSRDEEALTLLKEEKGRLLHSLSYNLLGDDFEAEECVADTLMKVWETVPPKAPESVFAYACKIARNLSLNRLEKKRAEKRGAGKGEAILDELCEILPSKENVEEKIELSCLTDSINRFLESIGKEQRIIFVKRYWYCKGDGEIANEMNVTLSKVRTSLSRTRKKLRSYLIKEGYINE